jgi:hypothetical protein
VKSESFLNFRLTAISAPGSLESLSETPRLSSSFCSPSTWLKLSLSTLIGLRVLHRLIVGAEGVVTHHHDLQGELDLLLRVAGRRLVDDVDPLLGSN